VAFEVRAPEKVFTIRAGSDAETVARVLHEAAAHCPARVDFEPGEYRLTVRDRTGLVILKDAHDLTIDGHGAKLVLVDGPDGKMDPARLDAAIKATGDKGVHGVQRGPVSITNITEIGTAYTLDEIRAVTDVAKSYGLKVHLDGARFANACAALGCSPAEMTWKAGVDAVSFGGTKNGCLGVEAVVFFDPAQAWELELRRKRGAHLFSKHRFLSAQMEAYVTDGLWLRLAERANAAAAELAAGIRALPGARLEAEPAGNMIFAHIPRGAHKRAMAAGAKYYLFPFNASLEGPEDEPIRCRFVCDWSCDSATVERLLGLFRG
jgi:threonine aldolase